MPVEFADPQRFDEARSHLRRDDVLPVWLAVIGGQLSQEFVVADPRISVEAGLGLNLLADPQRDIAGERNALQVRLRRDGLSATL